TAVATALAIGGAASPAAGASTAGGEGLWDQIRGLEIPSGRWPSVATAMGLSVRGEWISDDGLRWEHLDGRTVVVAHPRTVSVGGERLWDRVRAVGVPEDRWLAVAAELGLSVRGPWISDDGLRWEHLDGRTIVVAAGSNSP